MEGKRDKGMQVGMGRERREGIVALWDATSSGEVRDEESTEMQPC